MLQDILEERKCFKLVCGAGNEDEDEVEKLVAIYSKAGARYFDLSAKKEIVRAAYRGLDRVISDKEKSDYYMNVSVGIKGDPHVSKSILDKNKCVACKACIAICPQKAISTNFEVDKIRCIGCGRCMSSCKQEAISMVSEDKDLNIVLPPLISEGIDSIELHAVSDDKNKIYKQWKDVCNNFKGIISICTDRSHASDNELKERISYMIKDRPAYSTIIQADGAPMSGGKDDYCTTLQAVATAQIVQRMNIPVYLLLSGGTNSKSVELANKCGVKAHGVSIGLFGRNLVREYTCKKDFWEKKEYFEQAYLRAKQLVDKSLADLGESI